MRTPFFSVLVAGCMAAVSGAASADQTTCQLSPSFSLLKEFDTLNPANVHSWTVLHKGLPVLPMPGAEVRDIFGGNNTGSGIPTDCSGILANSDSFAILLGRDRDLVLLGGVTKGPHGATEVNFLHYYPHDGKMSLGRDGENILLRWGRQSDLTLRLCWSPDASGRWFHSGNHRTGGQFGACSSAEWIWHYGGRSGVVGTDPNWDHSRINHIVKIKQ